MPATTQSDLLAVTQKEFAKLEKLIAGIAPENALRKREEETSIKDVIAHRAHWIELFLGWYADGQADKEVHFPAPGYKWSELKRYNADLRQAQSDLDWVGAKDMLRRNYTRLETFIADHSEQDLYAGPMKGGKNAWTPGRWAEAAGPSHFRSAAKYIRAALKGT
ncbi:MAG: hypothetical protein BM558_14285 [Roseobacter sp. MedPE-SW]|nr:MAG: hypothetical protein BM558_14285 [Roseobacter sp. MedPE-SW]